MSCMFYFWPSFFLLIHVVPVTIVGFVVIIDVVALDVDLVLVSVGGTVDVAKNKYRNQ